MTVTIRAATAMDGDAAAALILDAGESLLIDIFGAGDRGKALAFLRESWAQGAGQYGFENHWIAEANGEVVGVVTCWHDALPEHFDRDTLASITTHFGLDDAIDIVMRSQQYSAALHPPLLLELGVGHLAVSRSFRRHGVATKLITFMRDKAKALKKHALVLDVELSNLDALAFYKANGFAEQQRCEPFVQLIKAVPPDIS